MKLIIDIIGVFAGIINNISMYPLAYNIYKIKETNELIKLQNMSISTHILQFCGCSLWLIYSIYNNLYPITFACILSIIPNSYIIYIIYNYKLTIEIDDNIVIDDNILIEIDKNINESDNISHDNTSFIIKS